MVKTRKRQVELRVHRRKPGERSGRQRDTVVTEFACDDRFFRGLLLEVPVVANQFYGGIIRFGTGVRENHLVESGWGQSCDKLCKLCYVGISGLKEGVVIRKFRQCFGPRLDQRLISIAELNTPQPRHSVEHLVTGGIVNVHTFPPSDHAGSGCA